MLKLIISSLFLFNFSANGQSRKPEPITERVEILVNPEKSFKFAFKNLTAEERLSRINQIIWNFEGFKGNSKPYLNSPRSVIYPPPSLLGDRSTARFSKQMIEQYEKEFWYKSYLSLVGYQEVLEAMKKKVGLLLEEKMHLEASYSGGFDTFDQLLQVEIMLHDFLPQVKVFTNSLDTLKTLSYIIQTPQDLEPVNGVITVQVFKHSAEKILENPSEVLYSVDDLKNKSEQNLKSYQLWSHAESAIRSWFIPQIFAFPLGPHMHQVEVLVLSRSSRSEFQSRIQKFEFEMDIWLHTLLDRLNYTWKVWQSSKERLGSIQKLYDSSEEMRDSGLITFQDYFKIGRDFHDAQIDEALKRTHFHTLNASLQVITGESPITQWR